MRFNVSMISVMAIVAIVAILGIGHTGYGNELQHNMIKFDKTMFDRCISEWRNEIYAEPHNRYRAVTLPSFKKIVEFGPSSIDYIFEKVENGTLTKHDAMVIITLSVKFKIKVSSFDPDDQYSEFVGFVQEKMNKLKTKKIIDHLDYNDITTIEYYGLLLISTLTKRLDNNDERAFGLLEHILDKLQFRYDRGLFYRDKKMWWEKHRAHFATPSEPRAKPGTAKPRDGAVE